MIYAVSAENQHKFASQLDQMFAQREMRPGFVSTTDDLDDEHAIYLIHVDGEGRVLESVRLNPVGENRPAGENRWATFLWPAAPSEALAEAVAAYCQINGLAPIEG